MINFVNTKIASKLIRKSLEVQLERKIENYDIYYVADNDVIFFKIDGIKYPVENGGITKLLNSQLDEHKTDNVHAIKISVNDDITLSVFMINEKGEKIKKERLL